MSLTYGFYNSLNGDRKYNAEQMSQLFDGIIKDGVFASIGTCLKVTAAGGLDVNVGIGRAWFNHTWTDNDSILTLTCDDAEVLLDRIDAVILDVNAEDDSRENSIKIIKGAPSSEPKKPEMVSTIRRHQHALAYITRKGGSTEITDSSIELVIGTDETPYVTGPLEVLDIDELLPKWRTELDEFVSGQEARLTQEVEDLKEELLGEASELGVWTTNYKNDFLSWYSEMKGQLSQDAAGNIQNEIDRADIVDVLMYGFIDGNKTFSDTGDVVTSEASDGRKLITVFTNGFTTITTTLYSSSSAEIAKRVTNINDDGSISSSVTYKP